MLTNIFRQSCDILSTFQNLLGITKSWVDFVNCEDSEQCRAVMTDRELVNEVCGKTVIPDPEPRSS